MIQIVFILFFSLNLINNNDWVFQKKLNLNIESIEIDNLQNIYTLKNTTVSKYDKKGNFLSEYSNSQYGNITSCDISDPMRILLFYEEYNQVIFLDNELAEISSPIMLDDLNQGQVKLACSSEQSGFWIYSQQNQELLHYNTDLHLINKSQRLSSVIVENIEPNFLIEKNNKLYLNIPGYGIMLFNIYGNYMKTIPIKELDDFQVKNQKIIFNTENCLVQFNIALIDYDTLCFNLEKSTYDIKTERDIAIILDENGLSIYNYE